MRNTVVLDFEPLRKWDFLEGVKKTTGWEWDTSFCNAEGMSYTKLGHIRRIKMYFSYSFHLFQHRKEFGRMIAWQQFFGIFAAFYGAVFHKAMPNIYLIAFIYKKRKGIAGKIYKHIIRKAFLHGGIKKAFVFSSNEPERYAKELDLPESYFVPETIGMRDRLSDFAVKDNGSYIAAGRSNRDYRWLKTAWQAAKGEQLVIVSDMEKQGRQGDICVRSDIKGDALFAMIAECHAVIIPLDDTGISSGQLVAIQAMMMGKPVIATENSGIREYIEDGVTGFVIPKTEEALQKAMQALADRDIYEQMAKNARKRYEANYSQYQMGMRIGKRISAWERQVK